MTKTTLREAELLKKLEDIRQITFPDDTYEQIPEDFNPMDASGGNFDDAYEMGVDEGEQRLANDIKQILNRKTT